MASTATAPRPNPPQNNTRGSGNKSRGRGGNKSSAKKKFQGNLTQPTPATVVDPTPVMPAEETKEEGEAAQEDGDVCWICAEPVKYYSLPECNHRTCHVCSLRLRALYKKMDCTFCKEPQPVVIFTESADALFSSFTPSSIEHKDVKLNIYFESQEMMEETLLLLRFNCPDPTCDYIGSSWSNLKLHVRGTHGRLMCDLCIRSKKVFAHEHALYPPNHLSIHLPSSSYRPPRNPPKEKDVEGGVHPLCEFCRECFFGSDELYAHMRERHEECFLCKRNEVKDQYFQDYESLERHFNSAHFACTQPSCQAQKFVVFGSAMDLKAHTVEQHGGDMSARDKRDLLRVQADFEFERAGRRPPDREREQEPPPGASNAAARRRQAFGGNLTSEGPPQAPSGSNNNPATISRRQSPEPPREDIDPAVAERHSQFISRLQALAPNPSSAVPSVKAAIRGYRAHEESARGLISTVWTVLGERLEPTASIINALVDLLEEEENKQELLASWRGFEIEQRRQFPDLVPTVAGSGYAGIATGRVLNIKHTSGSRSSHQSSRQVWDRVAQAASSSTTRTPPPKPAERFPALQASSSTPAPARQTGQRITPWSASARGAAPSSSTATRPAVSSSSKPTQPRVPPPQLNKASFPELPSSANTRIKPTVSGNTSLKNILGVAPAPAQPAWAGPGNNAPPVETPAPEMAEEVLSGGAGGKGKKGKGKQKQTLFTLGSFPT